MKPDLRRRENEWLINILLLCVYRQSGDFNVEYANTFPELRSMDLNTSTVLAQVTQDKYNFGTVGFFWPVEKQDNYSRRREERSTANMHTSTGRLVLLATGNRWMQECKSHGAEKHHDGMGMVFNSLLG